MAEKICLVSLGCAKNLINSEQMLSLLVDAGYEITDDYDEADVGIINTCGFIDSAKMEAIENIIKLGQYKQEGKLKKLIVTGCLAQRYKDELFTELPEIDAVLGVGNYEEIVQTVKDALATDKKISKYGSIDNPIEETGRLVSTGPAWAYIKIADGCDNRCAYCIIPYLRGRFRSRPMENIIEEAKALAESGVKELIVVAQDITRYGIDLYKKLSLADLLKELCKIDGIQWIRLHYLYPDEFTDELIDVIANEDKIVKYLDIPIQHINNVILKRMNRRGTGDEIRELFAEIRRRIPGVVLRTSLISGLPGEGEAEFEELCEFLREAKIERAGVFPYSPEEGTPAERMERPDTETANERAEMIMEIQAGIMDQFNQSRMGTEETVLCEGFDEEFQCYTGRSFAESPDIDGRILFTGENIEPGDFVKIKITEDWDGDLYGEQI